MLYKLKLNIEGNTCVLQSESIALFQERLSILRDNPIRIIDFISFENGPALIESDLDEERGFYMRAYIYALKEAYIAINIMMDEKLQEAIKETFPEVNFELYKKNNLIFSAKKNEECGYREYYSSFDNKEKKTK